MPEQNDPTHNPDSKNHNDGDKKSEQRPEPKDRLVETKHVLKLKGKPLKYTASTGTMVLKEEVDKEGHKAKAEIFYIAFTRDGIRNKRKRNITFSFNGGPGSSSVWMQLGLLGPKRVPLAEGNHHQPPPYHLEDNEFTLLEDSDLVFIDPIGTGYSRPLSDEKQDPKEFFSFSRDIESVGEFIRQYVTRNHRWSSPKFLIGESYGTTRATGLSGHLQDRYGLYLNGIMLISSILNFQTLLFRPGNDLPYILYLPSYAASAWYHGKLKPALQKLSLDDLVQQVRDFAEKDYALALMKGARLPEADRLSIVKQLAAFTGLDEEYISASDLRIEIMRFAKQLLRKEGFTVGRFDSRIKGHDRDEVGEQFEHDPSMDVVQGVYSACLNDYVRTELAFESDLIYEIISFKILPVWKYDAFENQYVNTADTLRAAMTRNPHLKIFVGNGYYDLATPFFATEYTFDHLGIKEALRDNITMEYYGAGHMMYMQKESLEKLSADLKKFVNKKPGKNK
jgi:carboxypeptidase C (cathepsin A)